MMTAPDLMLPMMLKAARAAIVDPARSFNVRAPADAEVRFELFHAMGSLCSQKVRAVMEEKSLAYRSNAMVVGGRAIPAENYHPDYVRLRLRGGKDIGASIVTGYTGNVSVDAVGFDPCVVPLLVDRQRGRVIVDSLQICLYLDSECAVGDSLVPPSLVDETMRQVKIVDETPHPVLLYGFNPDCDNRPQQLKESMRVTYDKKIAGLTALRDANREDPELVVAYEAKIAKEAGGRAVGFDDEYQRRAHRTTRAIVDAFTRELSESHGPFALGEAFTLADLVWSVSLIRMQYLGLSHMWSDSPRVQEYVARLATRPSIQKEAVQATRTSFPPSAYIADLIEQH